jgi:hypothetical protein
VDRREGAKGLWRTRIAVRVQYGTEPQRDANGPYIYRVSYGTFSCVDTQQHLRPDARLSQGRAS